MFEQKDILPFNNHKNFFLIKKEWGDGTPSDIVKLLDSVVDEFYLNLDINLIPGFNVFICNDLTKDNPSNTPMYCISNDSAFIFLTTQGCYWSQYAYQFSHELCHHVIGSQFPSITDNFGWLEESLCELASIYCLMNLSTTWITNPPYPNWKDYSSALKEYAEGIINNPKNKIDEDFKGWLIEKTPIISKDRYRRDENTIVAVKLFPLFKNLPSLWKSVQYINNVKVDKDMSLESYLFKWKEFLDSSLKKDFDKLINLLL